MARHDWCALVTNPTAEYTAHIELTRFGLTPYLPQIRKRWVNPRGGALMMRCYPLFPRYLLLPLRDSKRPAVHICRGVRRFKPILADAEGHMWRAPAKVIEAVKEAEARGDFNEVLGAGDKVELARGVLAGVKAVLTSHATTTLRVEVLLPLFGGIKAFVPQCDIARA